MTNNHIAPYDLSVSTPPFEQCPACGTEWAPALWIVVDADHRPDLLLAVQDHSLCTFRCGACANSISVNAPFLVVRGRTPRLMYSPSPGTTSLDDHNQLVSLLCRLKQAAAEHWDDKLAEELTIIARPLLPAELSNVAGRATHSATDLVNALLMADTTWKQQYMLARYPELYQADMWALLEKKIDEARQERNSSTLANLRAQYGLLTSCHRAGAAKIKSLLPSPRVYVSTTDLNDLLLESARAMLLRQSDAAVFSLLEATRRMKPAENPLLWAEIYLTLGELAEIDAAVDDDARLLAQQAYATVAKAAFPCGPWLAIRGACCVRLADVYVSFCNSTAEQDSAIRFYKSAIDAFVVLGDSVELLRAYDKLGFLYYQRANGVRGRNLSDALQYYQLAANQVASDENPRSWAAMQFNIGNTLLELTEEGQPQNIDQAIHHLIRAAAVNEKISDQDRLRDTVARLQLAYELRDRVNLELDPRSADLRRAINALYSRDWENAISAYKLAISKTEELLTSVYTEEGRQQVFADFGRAYSASAYACFRLERFNDAIALLEAGRARMLSEELQAFDVIEEKLPALLLEEVKEARQTVRALRTVRMISNPTSNWDMDGHVEKANQNAWLELSRILESIKKNVPEAIQPKIGERELLELAPEGGALILPVFSVAGCCVLVVPHGRRALTRGDLLWIDDFSDNDLMALLEGWSNSQNAIGRTQRRQAVADMCEHLWKIFACYIAERLKALNLAPGAPVVILPQGGIGVFALHAAAPNAASSDGSLGAYSISYAPSAYLLSIMQRRLADRITAADDFLGAVDPLSDLQYGHAEGALISNLFEAEHVTLLEGSAVTGDSLAASVVGKKYVHLSCHAFFTADGGKYAGLYLAHDPGTKQAEKHTASFERRPPQEEFFLAGRRWIVSSLDLRKCLLVTLSACESGRVDVGPPDEFLGLPAAFLRAGAAAVVSTLWRVDDVVAMLLTRKLYEGLVNDHLTPACALRQAQWWLREATNQSLYRLYDEICDQDQSLIVKKQLDRQLRRHALGAPCERPFSDPYYWAGFVVFGSA